MTYVLARLKCFRAIRVSVSKSERETHQLCTAPHSSSSCRSSTATPCSTARATKTNSSRLRASSARTVCGSTSTGSVCSVPFARLNSTLATRQRSANTSAAQSHESTDTASLIPQYNLDLDPEFEAQIGTHARKPWAKFVTSGRSEPLHLFL